MHRLSVFVAVVLTGCATGGVNAPHQEQGTTVFESNTGADIWIGGSPVQTEVLVSAAGDTYVGVWVDAPNDVTQVAHRAPMAVSLVIDTSGSMSGEKISNARMAASSLLETLADGDIVSIYGFASGVREIAAPTVLSRTSRGQLMQQVGMLQANGGTNMWGGMQAGIRRMSEAPRSHPIRRIMLISDGQANVGPSDPGSLGNLAARATEWGTQITAIGVGLDYDERTLASMAVRSSGRLYHLRESYQMASILEQELQVLAKTVAIDAYIEVLPAPGVVILEGLTMGSSIRDNSLRIPLGSVYAGQRREVLFRARVDTANPGARNLATARLVYRRPGENTAQETQNAAVNYKVTADRNAAISSVTPRVRAMVANYNATQAQMRAVQFMNSGRSGDAAVEMERAERELNTAAKAAPKAASSVQLRSRASRFRKDAKRARKAKSREEQRGAALDFNDDAMAAEGY